MLCYSLFVQNFKTLYSIMKPHQKCLNYMMLRKCFYMSLNIQSVVEKNTHSRSYIDITNEWFEETHEIRNEIKILQKNEIFEYKGKKYLIDNHFIKYRFKQKETNFAKWLCKNTTLKIQLNPEIEYPENVSVSDCTIYKNDVFLGNYDMKIVTGASKQLLFHNVDRKNNQAVRFLFEATHSPLSMNELVIQAGEIFRRKARWIEEIGIKKNNEFIILKNINVKK